MRRILGDFPNGGKKAKESGRVIRLQAPGLLLRLHVLQPDGLAPGAGGCRELPRGDAQAACARGGHAPWQKGSGVSLVLQVGRALSSQIQVLLALDCFDARF